jgi:photosystem II stability/assembly factor-like uncharacterized protein
MSEETGILQDIYQRDANPVYALAASPGFERDGICFAARASGLFRSEDGGLTWEDAYASLELEGALTTAAVAVSPSFETDHSVFAGVPGGVLRSMDGGRSWHIAQLPSPPPFVLALVVSPDFARDGTLLAGTLEDGVFRSGNRGGHWAAWNFGLLDLNVLSMVISPDHAEDETLFVGTESGIFRSTNGGRAWREVAFSSQRDANPTEWAPVLSLALSPEYAKDGVLLAGTEACGLFCSRDGGETWERLGEEVITEAVNSILLSPEYPARPEMLVLLGNGLLVSRDDGQTWSEWEADLHPEQGLASVVAPQGLAPGSPLLVGLVDGEVQRI